MKKYLPIEIILFFLIIKYLKKKIFVVAGGVAANKKIRSMLDKSL